MKYAFIFIVLMAVFAVVGWFIGGFIEGTLSTSLWSAEVKVTVTIAVVMVAFFFTAAEHDENF